MSSIAAAGSPLMTSTNEEWYTPAAIIDAVLQVWERIDLDPCSSSPPCIPARQHYTKEDDGLLQRWNGRVYVNPPYGREVDKWIVKALEEHKAGNVSEVIILVAARTDTRWFNRLSLWPWCSIKGRLKFSGHRDAAPFPSAVFYLGANTDRFFEVFRKLGPMWMPVPDSAGGRAV